MSLYVVVLSLSALLTLIVLFRWIFKAPERGIYAAFFTSGILQTVNLGPLREKVGLTELMILLTWLAMLINPVLRTQRLPLTGLQKLSLSSLGIFVLVYWSSFFINNATYYGYMIGSLVETLNLTYGALMVLTVVRLIQTPTQWKGCLVGWLAGAAVVSLVGIWALTGTAPAWTLDEFTGRICSTLKAENQIPSFLVPILVVAIVWSASSNLKSIQRVILLILIAAMSVTMIGTGSRTAFLLLILTVIAMIFVIIGHYRNEMLMKGYLGFSLILSAISLFFYISAALAMYDGEYALGHTPAWQRPVVTLYEAVNGNRSFDNTRTEQAEVIINNVDAAMFLGNGPKLYGSKFSVSEIHNTYAGVFFETGFLGVILFLFFLFCSFLAARYKSNDHSINLLISAAVVGFCLLLIYGMTMYGLRQRTIWLMAGLLISVPSMVNWLENEKE